MTHVTFKCDNISASQWLMPAFRRWARWSSARSPHTDTKNQTKTAGSGCSVWVTAPSSSPTTACGLVCEEVPVSGDTAKVPRSKASKPLLIRGAPSLWALSPWRRSDARRLCLRACAPDLFAWKNNNRAQKCNFPLCESIKRVFVLSPSPVRKSGQQS